MVDMKHSDIQWIGDIPAGWNTSKLKYLVGVQAGYAFDSSLFSIASGKPLIRIRDITSGEISTYYTGNYSDEYIVHNGDVLIGMDGDFNVRYWNNSDALLNQRCCRIIDKGKVNKKYVYYCLPYDLKVINDVTFSTTVKHLSNWTIENISIPIPSLSEQQAIADYLDDRCSKIDEIIAEITASIKDYKELKQAVIFEAVTKGLDKSVPMKDSGVEWIGEVPAHWLVKKFKYVASVNANLVSPDEYMDYQQIAPDSIEKDSGRLIKERTVSETGVESWNQLFRKGQLIYSKIRPILNKVIIAPYDGLCSADMYPLNVVEDTEFVQKAMLSRYFVDQVGLITQDRVKMPKINKEELANIYMAIPPREEQIAIVKYLDARMNGIDRVIDEKQSLIEDLQAYKKSLIYEVVTGKRRVV